MSELNFTHSNGNKVKLTTPDTLAANRTFKLPGADGTSGQVLQTDGNGNLSFVDPGGITHARNYRMHTTVDASGGSQIVSNWEYEDDQSSGHLGSGWSLPSSGVFSFPTTGIYDISMIGMMRQASDSNAWCGVQFQVSVNGGSSYDNVTEVYQQIVQASGKVISKRVRTSIEKFVDNAFDENGEYVVKDYETNPSKKACRWCEFKDNKELCKDGVK